LKCDVGDITNSTYINDYSTGTAVATNGLLGTYAISTTTKKVGTGSINFQTPTSTSYSGLSISKSVVINSFTIMGWYYMNTGLSYPRFFCIRGGSSYIEIYLTNNTAYMTQESNIAGNYSLSGTFTFNTWNHMAFVYDNTGGTLKTYMNNSLISTNTLTKFTAFNSSTVSISIDPIWANSQYIIGYVDDIRLYSYALLPSNIDTIYKLT
jgi:hypothetical protein